MEEKVLESQRVYQGHVLSLRIDTVSLDKGRQTRREIVEHGPSVAIVPLDAEGNAILVRQYRRGPGKVLLEIPAGVVEKGETTEDCVRRELKEETGYEAQRIEKIGGFYSAPGYCTEYLHLYLATGLRPGRQENAEDESIEMVRFPLKEIPKLIVSGEICDAKTIAGLLTVFHRSWD